MLDLTQHLSFLTGSSGDTSDERDIIQQWESLKGVRVDHHVISDPHSGDLEDEQISSVLDQFRFLTSKVVSESEDIISRLLAKPNAAVILPDLRTVLASPSPDDVISEEITELIGFDDMDLVIAVVQNRASVTQSLLSLSSDSHGVENTSKTDTPSSSQTRPPDLSSQAARKRMERAMREQESRPLFTGVATAAPEVLPHVYTSVSNAHGNILSYMGSKFLLPLGTLRENMEDYEEVTVPPAKTVPPRDDEHLMPVSELDPLAGGSFPGYKTLNRVQSIVYPTAYKSNENMLICAPTGAGKTDVAMLTILRVLDQHRNPSVTPLKASINRDSFKIIYVAPMKALAAEITRKLGKRLQWLGVTVKELTGDMQLTKQEIAETQIIVTTPEKWDVVTRKPSGEGELAARLKLLIIDEVHLLNEERGAVIETIVARTLRQVESSQSVIRIVGLSATLPNYIDVAEFLSVPRYTGLFYFDSSFRPVPLEQHFIGVRGKPNSPQSRKNLDRVTFEKVRELVIEGHQVMVFVHARKETVKSALALKEAAMTDGILDNFSCEEHPQWDSFRRSVGESRNKEMKQLFDFGFGIHHAGMLREDRNKMERMFEARAIKVLCCTATLAWGVNLPAHAVIIKGTQVYDSSKGSFVDLSVLDVLQVFGRAGRPGLESSGVGYICTTHDKLDHYLNAVNSQNPIESQFTSGMVDALNAEISLGTVANTPDAIKWLGYTYLFVRMKRNPWHYGIVANEDDLHMSRRRRELVIIAARKLASARMISFDESRETFTITDLGRIAAKYYIRHASIEVYNQKFTPRMTEADVLNLLSHSTEFEQIQLRDSEAQELKGLLQYAPCQVPRVTDEEGVVDHQGKVNVLLQAYISRLPIEDFALVSDSAYVSQNGGRIVRALLEIAISRKWATSSAVLMGMSKAIEKRLWPFDQPLKQFTLKQDVYYGLETWADDMSPAELASMTAAELGKLIHLNEIHGNALLAAAKQFPSAIIKYDLRPLGPDVLKIVAHVQRNFDWNARIHGFVEPFWLWIEDHEGASILQMSQLAFRQNTTTLDIDFVISMAITQNTPSVAIRFVSDRWMGAEDEVTVPLNLLHMPIAAANYTPKLDLPFLSLSVCGKPRLEEVYAPWIRNLNAIQTQVFWSLVKTRIHSLLCGPTGCGKSLLSQILACSTLLDSSDNAWVLIIAPRRSIAAEIALELRQASRALGINVDFSRETNPLAPPKSRTIRIVTSTRLLLSLTQNSDPWNLSSLRLVLCENLEELNASYELGLSLLRHLTQSTGPTRYVGLSGTLSDPADLAAWLDVDPAYALHSFRNRDRDQSLSIEYHTFTIPHSASLFKAMIKPAHAAIQAGLRRAERASSTTTALVFVPSRAQCRTVARDLIRQCALVEETMNGYIPSSSSFDNVNVRLEDAFARLQDPTLAEFVSQGVALFHDGIARADRQLMLELVARGVLRVLVAPREACWTVPIRGGGAGVVLVLGTQYYVHIASDDNKDNKDKSNTGGETERHLRDYTLAELMRMQSRAVGGVLHIFCQAEAKDTIARFLDDGLPLESQLLEEADEGREVLAGWYRAQKVRGVFGVDSGNGHKQIGVAVLARTYLARRMVSNPTYYDVELGVDGKPEDAVSERLSRVVDGLEESGAR